MTGISGFSIERNPSPISFEAGQLEDHGLTPFLERPVPEETFQTRVKKP
jgi:hypothetical protein